MAQLNYKIKCPLCGKDRDARKDYAKKVNGVANCKSCAATIRSTSHGQSRTRLYSIWNGMINRCHNENCRNQYLKYGARGITVCSDWKIFSNFKSWALSNGYKDTLTLDRKNNLLGYTESNCRWATAATQSQNQMLPKNNKSGYCGVHKQKGSSKYRARIRWNNKVYSLGMFINKDEAAMAYNAFIIKNKTDHTLNKLLNSGEVIL